MLQGEFSSLYMLVNASLEVKNRDLFELSSSDRSRSVSQSVAVPLCFTSKCFFICLSVDIDFACVLIR